MLFLSTIICNIYFVEFFSKYLSLLVPSRDVRGMKKSREFQFPLISLKKVIFLLLVRSLLVPSTVLIPDLINDGILINEFLNRYVLSN